MLSKYEDSVNSEQKRYDYQWLEGQLRGIRQELSALNIEDAFVVEVYETHATLALKNQSLDQFIQCLSRLMTLYEAPEIKDSEASKN